MSLYALASGAIFGAAANFDYVGIPRAIILAADGISKSTTHFPMNLTSTISENLRLIIVFLANPIGTPSPVANATVGAVIHIRLVRQQHGGQETTSFTNQTENSRQDVVTTAPGVDPTLLSSQAPPSGFFDGSSCTRTSRITIDTVPPTSRDQIFTTGDVSSASDVPSTKDHYTTTFDISQGRTIRPTSSVDQHTADRPSANDANHPPYEVPRHYSDLNLPEEGMTPIGVHVINPISRATAPTPGIIGDPPNTDSPMGTRKPQDERPGTTHENPHPFPTAVVNDEIATPVDATNVSAVPTECERPSVPERDDSTLPPMSTRTCERPFTSERGDSTGLPAGETSAAMAD
jgi:hypothetical protein